MLGRQHLLSEEDMRKLAAAREKYGSGNHSLRNDGRTAETKSRNGKEAALAGRKR
jgi:hypothetical protein